MPPAQHVAFNIAPQMWSLMTAVLDMKNICIAAIILSKASVSEPLCPWLKCCLSVACVGFFDVRTLPPADSLLYTIRGAHNLCWLTEDVGWSCSDVKERSLLDLTTFWCFCLLSCRESGFIFMTVLSASVWDVLLIWVDCTKQSSGEMTQNNIWVI